MQVVVFASLEAAERAQLLPELEVRECRKMVYSEVVRSCVSTIIVISSTT